ncbi:hypothetical protein D6D12_06704 [Aureobasidium pullulans]|uniref:F-box domain-containing protein n=1 Tax=Aureobasidium pullulans TaxID=5580 RepID=A0AB74JNL9_AURPU|nr:hypothetical protein D6D12_06704 [Aureobasidium pullulans]THX64943.1 hypothetical protein D6D11_00812 [Aureobasidium pullulans]
MAAQENTFPPEIWTEIVECSPQQTLVALSRVCSMLSVEVRKVLLRSVASKETSGDNEKSASIIYRPWAFHDMLVKEDTNWRSTIRFAKLNWLGEYLDKDGKDALIGRAKPVADHLIFKTAMMLSECAHLHDFQVNSRSLTIATAMLNTKPLQITSLSFSLPHRYSWEDLYRIFEIPTLSTLVVKNLLSPDRPAFRFPPPIPDELHLKSAISNIQDLTLDECGPLTSAIVPMFKWPRNLRKLDYSPSRSKCEPYWRGILRRMGDISDAVDLSVHVLSPVKDSLEELKFDLGLDRHWILPFKTGGLFQSFANLTKLNVPVELIMHSRGLSQSRLDHPFYATLPQNLRDLTLKFTILTSWHPRPAHSELQTNECLLSDPAHRFFDELSEMAMCKEEFFPSLKQLRLTEDGERPFLVKCVHTKHSLEDLGSSGIQVVQGDWYRQSKETWV